MTTVRTKIDLNNRYAVVGMEGIAFHLLGFDYDEFWSEDGRERVESEDRVRMMMVGDDRVHVIDIEDLIPISDDDYCGGCGQIGCGHG